MPYARLDDRAALRLSGPEAGSFLQNLVTADIPTIAENTARPSALLTPQGKILFDFLVSHTSEGFRIDCASQIRDALAKRLTLYKLRAKVTIEPIDEAVFAAWGLGEAPRNGFRDERFGGADVFRLYGEAAVGGFEAPASWQDFRALRVRSGVVEAETDFPQAEMFPHDVLLDQTNGVSFKKGCYVGQEVVSRMQHRGTARRRLMLVKAERHLTEGANVTSDTTRIGTLLMASETAGIAVIRTDKLASRLGAGETLAVDGVPVELTIPPWAGYTLPTPTAEVAGDAD